MKNLLRVACKWTALFILASVLVFYVTRLMPGSPAEQLLFAYQLPPTADNLARLNTEWGLDQSLIRQYWMWISNFVQGDWGKSMISKVDIRQEFMGKLPYSLTIGLGGILSAAGLSFVLGYRAALHNHGFSDRITRLLALFSQTVPNFILSVLVIYYLGVYLKLVHFFVGSHMPGVITAAVFVCLYSVGGFARIVKIHFREQMQQTYIKFAISRGFSKETVLLKHAYKPVLHALLSVVISNLAWILGGSAVLEFAFSIPGISFFLVDSMKAKDYFVLQSYVMVIMLWMFGMHMIFNLFMRLLEGRGER